jgi:8-oxo-dGTP pyrophosphatase MutT (NUDIX family)
MKRSQLLTLLEQYIPQDAQESEYEQRIVDFVKAHEDCFERSLAIGHVTASAWLLNKDGSKALLMHHAKLNRWFQLGGHCDGDSDVCAVAVKEAQEESGIMGIKPVDGKVFDVDVHLIPANSKEQAHFHYDIRFLLQVTSDEDVVQNRESKELRWIGKDAQELPTDERSVTRMFNKWLSL